MVLGRSLKFAALSSELAVDELAVRRNLKGATAAWFASDGAALDVGLQLHLQSIEGGLVASGTTVFDVDNERHACTVLWVVRSLSRARFSNVNQFPRSCQESTVPDME